jgi:hypothetical protein
MLGANYFRACHVQDFEAGPSYPAWSTGQRTPLNFIVICPVSAFVPEIMRKAILFAFVGAMFSLSGPFWPPEKVVVLIIIIIIIIIKLLM